MSGGFPPLARARSGRRSTRDGMAEASPLTIFTTAVNFALGAGVLGLPYAMASAGIVASVLSLVTVALISFLISIPLPSR